MHAACPSNFFLLLLITVTILTKSTAAPPCYSISLQPCFTEWHCKGLWRLFHYTGIISCIFWGICGMHNVPKLGSSSVVLILRYLYSISSLMLLEIVKIGPTRLLNVNAILWRRANREAVVSRESSMHLWSWSKKIVLVEGLMSLANVQSGYSATLEGD